VASQCYDRDFVRAGNRQGNAQVSFRLLSYVTPVLVTKLRVETPGQERAVGDDGGYSRAQRKHVQMLGGEGALGLLLVDQSKMCTFNEPPYYKPRIDDAT
jgi:hypothetical protein